jgi:hypothetical protein
MTFPQTIWLAFLLFIISPTFGQEKCDTLSSNLIKEFDMYSTKKIKRLINKRNLEPIIAFNIATYLRHKSDTTYKQWYTRYIELLKKKYNKLDSGESSKPSEICVIFTTGKAYYYLDDFKKAYLWFSKAKQTKCTDNCIDLFLEQTEKRIDIKDK